MDFGAAVRGVVVLRVAMDFRFSFDIVRSAETYSKDTGRHRPGAAIEV